jgi:hypothetical protein
MADRDEESSNLELILFLFIQQVSYLPSHYQSTCIQSISQKSGIMAGSRLVEAESRYISQLKK